MTGTKRFNHSILMAAAFGVLCAGCSGSGKEQDRGRVAASESSSDDATKKARFGTAQLVDTDGQSAKVTVGPPEPVVLHESECCADGGDDLKGKSLGRYQKVSVGVVGVSGTFDADVKLQFRYVGSDGTLVKPDNPIPLPFEDIDSFEVGASSVREGQKVDGELIFKTSDAGGYVQVEPRFELDDVVYVWSRTG